MRHRLCPDQLQYDMPTLCQPRCFLFHHNGREAALKEMAHAAMSPVLARRVAPIELLHVLGKDRLREVHQQMILVVPQTIGVAEPPGTIHQGSERCQNAPPVLITPRNGLAGIAPTGNVIDRVRNGEAERADHGW